MKAGLKSKGVVGISTFLLGVLCTLLTQHFLAPKPQISTPHPTRFGGTLDSFFDDEFFAHSKDPFEEMKRMREMMMKQMGDDPASAKHFNLWYKNRFGGEVGEISSREDEKNIYYEIKIKDVNDEKLDVKVENGIITVSGQVEEKIQENDGESISSANFQRSFPTPPHVDSNRVEIEKKKNKIVLKFPKKSA